MKLVLIQIRISYFVSGILGCVYNQTPGTLHIVLLLWIEIEPFLKSSPNFCHSTQLIKLIDNVRLMHGNKNGGES